MKKLLLTVAIAAAFLMPSLAQGTLIINSPGVVSENFDGLPSSTQSNFFSPTVGVQTAITGTAFDGTKIAGTGTTGASLLFNFGDSNSGGVHNLGATASTDRALGLLASGTNIMAFGVAIQNNTGLTLDSATIAFTQENWRTSTSNVNTLVFGYSFGPASTNYLTAGGFAVDTALDMVGPAPVASNGAIDGNDPSNQVAKLLTLSNLTWASGDFLYLRWSDFNDVGSDATIAMDNFSIRVTAVPEPTALLMVGMAVVGCVVRRRRIG